MELRVLRYFLAVVREGSISGAARVLHVTQPTLSRQLQDLEEELGQKLLIRGSHNVSLTAEGMFLRKRAEEIMEMVDKTESEFNSIGENINGDIYIGGGETEAMRLVVRIMKELREDYPGIRYHIYSGNADDVMERLDKGMLDFGILIQPVDISKYDYVTLPVRDTWGVVMRKDDPLAAQKTIHRKDLLGIPLICSRQAIRHSSVKCSYGEWFGKDIAKLNIAATHNLIFNAALMVEEGIGCVLTLAGLVDVTGHNSLCFRPLEPKLESSLDIVWKKYQVFSKAAEVLLKRIQDEFTA